MICLSCKESVNRLRLKEQQAHLLALVKYQQAIKEDRKKANEQLCSDSCSHNKLLVALCCFAHDQESMHVLLSNGLVESLLGFLNDSIMQEKEKRGAIVSNNRAESKDYSMLFRSQSVDERLHVVALSDILQVTGKEVTPALGKKRKISEPSVSGLIPKRSKTSGQVNLTGSFVSAMDTSFGSFVDTEQQAGVLTLNGFQPQQNQVRKCFFLKLF